MLCRKVKSLRPALAMQQGPSHISYICTISHLYSHKVLDRKRKINFTIALLLFSLKMGHLALSSKTWSKRKGISQHGNSNEKDVMSLRTEFLKAQLSKQVSPSVKLEACKLTDGVKTSNTGAKVVCPV